MNYKETLDYLFNSLPMFQRIGGAAYKADLSNTIKLCELLGNPEMKFNSVHIAGTNGKGSTSNMLASVLQEKGLKVGLYTSPHLRDFRERIRINGEMIDEVYVSGFVDRFKSDFEVIKPSFFEMTYAMAIKYFHDNNVDIAVMECGMGGRLDSTNTVKSILSIITNIGLDHIQFLGDTVEEIAVEKAGIIKNGIPVVIGETDIRTKDIFTDFARKHCSDIVFADDVFSVDIIEGNPLMLNIFKQGQLIADNVVMPLIGNYQLKNILTVSAAVNELNNLGFGIDKGIFCEGIKNTIVNTGFAGRWQILNDKPLTICDTGHNEDGIKYVTNQIASIKYSKLRFVLGMVNDKDINKILNLLPKDALYYFCKADIPRGLPASELRDRALLHSLEGNVYDSVKSAFDAAINDADENDLVFIGGSTFTVAEVV